MKGHMQRKITASFHRICRSQRAINNVPKAILLRVCVDLPSCSCITGQVLHWQVATMICISCLQLSQYAICQRRFAQRFSCNICFMKTAFVSFFKTSTIHQKHFLYWLKCCMFTCHISLVLYFGKNHIFPSFFCSEVNIYNFIIYFPFWLVKTSR